MDMHVFQVESNKVLPQQGSILISSPFMNDYHFTRAVVLLIEHNDEGSMGIIMNKDFRYHILLNDLIPELEFAQRVPVYKGGPVSRETIFFLHTLKDLEGALPLGNGLYLNGDFNAVQQYILDGKPIEGVIRFFAGYALPVLVGGIWISLSHLAFGVLLCITVIGIPFGLQHFKLAGLALTPFGKEIV